VVHACLAARVRYGSRRAATLYFPRRAGATREPGVASTRGGRRCSVAVALGGIPCPMHPRRGLTLDSRQQWCRQHWAVCATSAGIRGRRQTDVGTYVGEEGIKLEPP